jgi:cell division protein FtsB
MTPLEAALIVIIVALLLFVIYYYWRGAKGDVSLARPVESRVDEYLDRRFELMIDEWSLVSRAKLQSFRQSKDQILETNEAKVASLKDFSETMEDGLKKLEDRLDALEKQAGKK